MRDPQTGHLISPVISPVVAATLWIKPRCALTSNQARKVDALKQASRTCCFPQLLHAISRVFQSRKSARLEEWIDDAIHSGRVFLARFARVLLRDIDAVCKPIELPWSNGQAKGRSID